MTDGNGGANYAITFVNDTTGEITGRAITVTAASDTKGYDATTSSDGVPTITSGSLAGGDTATFTQTFDTANVGTGKTLTPAGTVNDGNGGASYTITFVNDTTGEITARAITVTATTDTKAYDATTASAAIPTITTGTLAGADTRSVHPDLRHRRRGNGQDAHPGGLRDRRQRGCELRGHVRVGRHRRDHRPGDHRHRRDRHQGLRRHHQLRRASRPSRRAAWLRATPRPSPRPSATPTSAPARP